MSAGVAERQKLRCRNDRWEYVDWSLRPVRDGGIVMIVECDLGNHFLHPRGEVGLQPYVFPSSVEAWRAVETWKQSW